MATSKRPRRATRPTKPRPTKKATAKPATKKPTAKKPTAKKPTTKKPTTTPRSRARAVASAAWDRLSHAYGKATDLPEKLAALEASSARQRKDAIYMIGASICHQGTFYSATPVTVPLLLDIVGRSTTKDQARIVRLLADILTVDDHTRFLFTGMPATPPPRMPAVYLRSVKAARAGLTTYVALLTDKLAEVRSEAAFALAWIGERAIDAVPHVRRALDHERDTAARASLVLALAFLAVASDTAPAHADVFTRALADRDAIVRAAAAIACSHVARGDIGPAEQQALAAAGRDASLVRTGLPWLGGNLALFAVQVLAASPPTDDTNATLLALVETGAVAALAPSAAFAANVLARRVLGPPRPAQAAPPAKRDRTQPWRHDREDDRVLGSLSVSLSDLEPAQRALLDALVRAEAAFDGAVSAALAERGYPSTPKLVRRFLTGEAAPASLLDRPLTGVPHATVCDAIVAMARGSAGERGELARALVAELSGDTALEAAQVALVDLDIEGEVVALTELAWAAGPTAGSSIERWRAHLEAHGEPTRNRGGSIWSYPQAYVLTAIAAASAALASGTEAPTWVDAWLQKTYGFFEKTRDALAALPVKRREQWVLHEDRDSEPQPAQYFQGAWPYFVAAPTPRVIARVLEHVATWKPKDKWGGARSTFAVPHLTRLRDAVHVAGGDTRALDATLAKLRA